MRRRPPRSPRTATLFPSPTLFRSFEVVSGGIWGSVTNKLRAKAVDLLPATLKAFTTPAVRQYIDFSSTYYVGTTVVITRNKSRSIFDLDLLNGKVVAMKGGGAYQSTIQQRYPDIHIQIGRAHV